MQAWTYIIHPKKKKRTKFLLAGGSIGRGTCSSINKEISQLPLVLYDFLNLFRVLFFFSGQGRMHSVFTLRQRKEKAS